ncbi:MAG: hypothetical protein IKS59_03840 [Aeriscardovia sp.]|nr:hypothetical protein [Aeriscardovia sp.]
MLKSFAETIYKQIVDCKPNRTIFSEEQRDKILFQAKRVRQKDYLLSFDLNDVQLHSDTVTTTANWYFVLTGAAVLSSEKGVKVGIKFQNFYPTSPFGTSAVDMNNVPYDLVFGREGLTRFEEYKNLYYSLGERVTVNVDVQNTKSDPTRIQVLLTGLEINLQDEGVE